ncbi:putative 5-amino-6-(5-phosphoribosylamino)uracil reductase [Helianthus anomalus]
MEFMLYEDLRIGPKFFISNRAKTFFVIFGAGPGRDATAYINMEPEDCHGISRVVIGMRYPLQHLRGKAIHTLRNEGMQTDVHGEDMRSGSIESRLSPFTITIGQKEEEIKQDPLTEHRSVWGLKGGGGGGY